MMCRLWPEYMMPSNGVASVVSIRNSHGNMVTNANLAIAYDARSRLASVCDAVYTNGEWKTGLLVSNRYDHVGRRVQKITCESEVTFFYDGWNLVEERIAYTNGNTSTIHYYWGKDLSGTLRGAGGVGGLLYLTITNSQLPTHSLQLYIPCYDNNGNITRYLDSSGNTVAQYIYDAFGNAIGKSGPMCDFFCHRFSTKYIDAETGLYYYGYRFYCPWLMRWINRDPIEDDGGTNVYGFVLNLPSVLVDMDGCRTWTEGSARKEVSDKIDDMRKKGYHFAADALQHFLGNNKKNLDLSKYAHEVHTSTPWRRSYLSSIMAEVKKRDPYGVGKEVEIGDIAHKNNFGKKLEDQSMPLMFKTQFHHRFYPNQSMALFYALYGSHYSYYGKASWCHSYSRNTFGEHHKEIIKTDIKIVSYDKLAYPDVGVRTWAKSYDAAHYLENIVGYSTPYIFLQWQDKSTWTWEGWNVRGNYSDFITRK